MQNVLNLNEYGVAEMQYAEMEQAEGGHNESEIRFLMDANNWSRAQAVRCLDLANEYACTPKD